jgi:hypothetical protein
MTLVFHFVTFKPLNDGLNEKNLILFQDLIFLGLVDSLNHVNNKKLAQNLNDYFNQCHKNH